MVLVLRVPLVRLSETSAAGRDSCASQSWDSEAPSSLAGPENQLYASLCRLVVALVWNESSRDVGWC